ncbi:MAG: hypothetical protein ABW003_18980 [Microvirga sp.]
MLESVIKLAVVIALNGAVSGFAGWGFTSLLDYFDVFGSGPQSGLSRSLGILFIGFPLSWLSIFILLMATHGMRAEPAIGSWGFVGASALGFIILFVGYYAILFASR